MDRKIRVLVVDDSALMRREIRNMLMVHPDLEVVGAAKNGEEAVTLAKELNPDVVTMDINMPVMDGLTALQYIMMESPRPVIMLSSLTQDGAVTSYEALELGAVDFIEKPGGTVSTNIEDVANQLIEKIKTATGINLTVVGAARRRRRQQKNAFSRAQNKEKPVKKKETGSIGSNQKIVVIGQSTGGPNTILEVLPAIPENFPAPIIIVQHMPGSFTPSFAQRLDKNCAIPFKEVKSGERIEMNVGYLAPGDIHTTLASDSKGLNELYFRTTQFPEGTLHKPSVDVTMRSIAEFYNPKNIIAVLLTGMGADGAHAMAEIRKSGGRTIAESEETAIVFGMPKEAIRLGGAEFVLPADQIGKKIVELVLSEEDQI